MPSVQGCELIPDYPAAHNDLQSTWESGQLHLFIDNGPQFDSRDFTNFSTDWQSQHITSSPRQHKSNGEVKRAVQTMKMVLNKSSDE